MWFREDVARILASAHDTMMSSLAAVASADAEMAQAYRRGFVDALRAVAIAFGLGASGERGAAPAGRATDVLDIEVSQPTAPERGLTRWGSGKR